MKVSKRGVHLVAQFEGFPNGGRPYLDRPASDPLAVWTYGHGFITDSHGRPVTARTPPITYADSLARLRRELDGPDYGGRVDAVCRSLGRSLTVGQRDALVSAVFNLGAGVLDAGRSLGDALRSDDWRVAVPAALPLYSEPGNPNVHLGLLRRRKAEARVWSAYTIPSALTASEAALARILLDARRTGSTRGVGVAKSAVRTRLRLIGSGDGKGRPVRRAFLRSLL